ncbi:hypothetical protein F2Q70_00025529 [Brassica cretica]|uniref:Uncharacterized protein n=2 Tax=Brassica cretica TaxID=69181 RepID=A0A8S9L8J5_BRACR|nr:hypothetical protein F2Q68_00024938 [Brassica cretica]KAF2602331.1 hypothetical protein F2Q70_00025529 [Brassica cretica]KAF3581235.1 hypothetical protein DY000_02030229 [Brassica cretica]
MDVHPKLSKEHLDATLLSPVKAQRSEPLALVFSGQFYGLLKGITLQENSGILTDIPTENEILGISRGISEEIPRKHKIGFPQNFLGIYRRNSEEISIRRNIPRKNGFLGKNR